MILAIDPGTLCGWALYKNGTSISGVWNLEGSRYDGGGMRYLRLLNHLEEVGRVDLVGYEEVHSHMKKLPGMAPTFATDAAHIYGGIVATLTAWCERQQPPIAYCGVPVGTIKKRATGRGNAKKEDVLEAAQRSFPAERIATFDQADARWILECLLAEHGKALLGMPVQTVAGGG